MICTPALLTKPIPVCIGDLTIGKVSYSNTNMTLFILDITTGRTEAKDFTTLGDGTCTIDVAEFEFSDKQSYNLFVTKEGASTSAKESIYIGTEDNKNISLDFVRCFEDGEEFSLPSVTLEVK